MTDLVVVEFDADLANGEVGDLVDIAGLVNRHPDGVALSADGWAQLRQQRQAAGRLLHWWEVATHG